MHLLKTKLPIRSISSGISTIFRQQQLSNALFSIFIIFFDMIIDFILDFENIPIVVIGTFLL